MCKCWANVFQMPHHRQYANRYMRFSKNPRTKTDWLKLKVMDLRKVSRIHLTINLILIILFYINKRYLRPNYSDIIFVSTILGCLPNLIGAFMFSLLPMSKTLKLNLCKGRVISDSRFKKRYHLKLF